MTGSCECTSIPGPGLGGGHGLLQGRHGLVSDQFVSLDLVQADGSLQTIDANSELWWAMQGAGHNFGVVTSLTMKTHDVKHPDWAFQSWIFTGASIEALASTINEQFVSGQQPVDIVHFTYVMNIPEIDPEHVRVHQFTVQLLLDANAVIASCRSFGPTRRRNVNRFQVHGRSGQAGCCIHKSQGHALS